MLKWKIQSIRLTKILVWSEVTAISPGTTMLHSIASMLVWSRLDICSGWILQPWSRTHLTWKISVANLISPRRKSTLSVSKTRSQAQDPSTAEASKTKATSMYLSANMYLNLRWKTRRRVAGSGKFLSYKWRRKSPLLVMTLTASKSEKIWKKELNLPSYSIKPSIQPYQMFCLLSTSDLCHRLHWRIHWHPTVATKVTFRTAICSK